MNLPILPRWAATLTLAAFLPAAAFAGDLEHPVSVTLEPTSTVSPGGTFNFEVTITANEAADNLDLTLSSAGIVSLESSDSAGFGSVLAGQTVSFNGMARLLGTGSGRLEAFASATSVDPCNTTKANLRRRTLGVSTDGTFVGLGDGSEMLAELALIRERRAAGVIDNLQSSAEVRAVTTVQVPNTGMPMAAGGAGVIVAGTARFRDEGGALQDASNTSVEIFRQDGGARILVARGAVTPGGEFEIVMQPGVDDLGPGPRRLFAVLLSANPAAVLRSPVIPGISSQVLRHEMDLGMVADGTRIDAVRLHGSTDTHKADTINGALSIGRSMMFGRAFVAQLDGAAPVRIDVNYPVAGASSTVDPSAAGPQLLRADRNDWDVAIRYYGLAIFRTLGLVGAADGDHNPCEDLISRYGKALGTELAWSEGLAMWFSIAAQRAGGAISLGIPRVGDTFYEDFGDASLTVDLETRSTCRAAGEGNETNVARALWDITDSNEDTADTYQIDNSELWDVLVAATPIRFFDVYVPLTMGLPLLDGFSFGRIMGHQQISPSPSGPTDGTGLGSAVPTFEWGANGLDDFVVRFLDVAGDEIFASGSLGDVQSWAPTPAEWNTIRFEQDIVFWLVEGTSRLGEPTGPYRSGTRALGGVDFAFVIDDTGSMGQEINGIRTALVNFIDSFPAGTDDVLFQLTTFKDNFTTRRPTSDLTEIRAQLAALVATGGADCPEQSEQALLTGTLIVKRGGTVMFATDAEPRPGSDDDALVNRLRAQGVRVNVLLSGTCNGFATGSPDTARLSLRSALNQPGINLSQPFPKTSNLVGFANAVDFFSKIATATGGTFAFIPEVNSSGPGVIEYQNTAENILQSAVERRLVLATPAAIRAGVTATVTLAAQNATFFTESTVDFGPGITINRIDVLDPVTLRVSLNIEPGATSGFRDVTVSTPIGGSIQVVSGFGIFQVLAGNAGSRSIASITPPVVQVGTRQPILIEGRNTSFSDATMVFMGTGITVDSITVLAPDEMIAEITVDPTAEIGFKDVSITTGSETVVREVVELFRVESEAPEIAQVVDVSPNASEPGTTLAVQIDVTGMSLDEGETLVNFSGTGIEVLDLVACDSFVRALVRVDGTAGIGTRDVLVLSGDTIAIRPNGFTVTGTTAAEVNFDFDDLGPLVNGQAPTFGGDFTLTTTGPNVGAGVFDSSPMGPNAASSDPDLLVGLGNVLILQESGAQSSPGIYATPDDAQDGGAFIFDFAGSVEVLQLDLIDLCPGPGDQRGRVILTDGAGRTRTAMVPAGWTTDVAVSGQGFGTLDLTGVDSQPGAFATATIQDSAGFNSQDVRQLRVELMGSGAMDNLFFRRL